MSGYLIGRLENILQKMKEEKDFACVDFIDCFTDKNWLPMCWDVV